MKRRASSAGTPGSSRGKSRKARKDCPESGERGNEVGDGATRTPRTTKARKQVGGNKKVIQPALDVTGRKRMPERSEVGVAGSPEAETLSQMIPSSGGRDDDIAVTPPRKRTLQWESVGDAESPRVRGSASRGASVTPRRITAGSRCRVGHQDEGVFMAVSPSNTLQSGEGYNTSNASLLVQRSIQKSQETLKNVISEGIARMESRVSDLERFVKGRMNQYEDALFLSIRFIAEQLRSKEGKARINVQLAPLNSIYSGSFYNRIYGMQFIVTFNKMLKEFMVEGTEKAALLDVLEEGEAIMHALVFRRIPSEKSAAALAKSETFARVCRFRKELCVSMIKTAENNESIGADTISLGSDVVKLPRPKWLRKGYIKKSVINEAFSAEDRSKEASYKVCAPKRKSADGSGGTIWEEYVEREILSEEIVKRLNQKHVQHLNKSRESVRIDFFNRLGFLWHHEVNGVFKKVPHPAEDIDFSCIPNTETWRPGEEDTVRRKNLEKWHEVLERFREEMGVTVEYDVEVFEKKPFVGIGTPKKVIRSINLLLVALSFSTRFTMCFKADDFFAMHTAAMHTVFVIACLFREMIITRSQDPTDLPRGEKEISTIDTRDIEDLVLDLVPTFASTRSTAIHNGILRMSDEKYKEIDSGAGGLENESSGMFLDDEGNSGGSESEEDEEILALRDVNFRA